MIKKISLEYPALLEWNSHCTILYLGEQEVDDLPKQLMASLLHKLTGLIHSHVTGQDMFGKEKNVPVLLLDHPLLMSNRILAMSMLKPYMEIPDDFPVYRPHVTIDNPKVYPPERILLGTPHFSVWNV